MKYTKSLLPVPSFYHSIMGKLSRYIIRTKVVDKILQDPEFDSYVKEKNLDPEELVHLFIEYSVIFLTIENNDHIDFNNPGLLRLVEDTWESVFSKMESRLSESISASSNLENIKTTFRKIDQLRMIPEIEKILKTEIAMAGYRSSYYPVKPSVTHAAVLYSGEHVGFFTPFASMDMDLKLRM